MQSSHEQVPALGDGPTRAIGPDKATRSIGKDEKSVRPVSGCATAFRAVLILRDRDQMLFAAMCVIAVISLVVYCARTSHWGAEPIELARQPAHQLDYRIDLNSLSWIEWSQIPGIGPQLGQRIVEEQERNGPFRGINDLMRVKGVGAKRLREMQPYIRVPSPDVAPHVGSKVGHDR